MSALSTARTYSILHLHKCPHFVHTSTYCFQLSSHLSPTLHYRHMPKHNSLASIRLIALSIVLQRRREAEIEKKTAWLTKCAHVHVWLQICRYIRVDCMWNESPFCGQSQESQWDIQDASWDSSCFPSEIFGILSRGPKSWVQQTLPIRKRFKTFYDNKLFISKIKQVWSVARCHNPNKLVCPPRDLCSDQ